MSARIIVQNGPARMRVKSTTLIPDSGTPVFLLVVIASAAKQSRGSFPERRDCFVAPLLAMTTQ
jgi:hypothetical protein